ncbi:MAG TPA: hypothetical protein VMT79_02245 [Candidatus Binatia bacterium]|nr:hypothetical protein [Candidatus Binatia bacterium]
MAKRQHGFPSLVESTSSVRELERVAFLDPAVKERWIQNAIFANPALLPTGEIEPAYAPLRPVARELPTQAGPVDLLCVNPSGYLTFIETKLIRNPEQRRQVVAQLLDYTSQIVRWTYDDLVDAIRRANKSVTKSPPTDPLFAAAQEADGDDIPQAQFRAAVARGLRVGRFLWLVVGDDIREDLKDLVGYLDTRAHLQFTLALVSLGLYRLNASAEFPVLVIPRLVSRTTEVVRTIVRFEGEETLKPLPKITASSGEQKSLPGLEGYLERVDIQVTGPAEAVRRFLNDLEVLGVEVDDAIDGGSVALRFPDEVTGIEFRLFRLDPDGTIRVGATLRRQIERAHYPVSIADNYARELSELANIPLKRATGDVSIPIPARVLVLENRDAYIDLAQRTLDAIRKAGEERHK